MQKLGEIPGVRLIGTAQDKASVMSFVLAGYNTEEIGQALNKEGIAVRTGHHSVQPILRRFGVETTVRPSLAFYKTSDEIDQLAAVVRRLAGRGEEANAVPQSNDSLPEICRKGAVIYGDLERRPVMKFLVKSGDGL